MATIAAIPTALHTTDSSRRRGMLGAACLFWAALVLAGCAPVRIDTRHVARSQDSRVQFLVLHYTDENLAGSLRILTEGPVSSHYLVSDETPPRIYRLVDEDRRAWHAGDSHWRGTSMLNAASIGIEIVNPGASVGADGQRRYAPYPPEQIDLVVALVKDIVGRHGIDSRRIVGHSDIAPQRKTDPGPLFPWKRLADEGLVPWPDATRVATLRATYEVELPTVAWYQQQLQTQGFRVPDHGTLDDATRRVVAAFQMRYRPALHDGQPDAETAALLRVLNTPVTP
jgi:N-acetylmuramoyl-L-alanine amidase